MSSKIQGSIAMKGVNRVNLFHALFALCLLSLSLPLAGCAGAVLREQQITFLPGAQEAEVHDLSVVNDGNIREVLTLFNPELRALRHGTTAAEFDVEQAGLYPNPSMGLKAEEISLENPDSDDGKRVVVISQKLEPGGKRGARIELAQERMRAARLSYQARIEELVRDARKSLFDLLLLRRIRELTAQLVEFAKERLSLTEKMREQGAVSEIELLKVRVAATELAVFAIETQKKLDNQATELRRLLGIAQDAKIEFEGELVFPLPAGYVPELRAGVSTVHPELQKKLQDVAVAAAMQSVEERAAIPDIRLDFMCVRKEKTDDEMGGIGLGFDLPIFDRRQGAIRSAESRVEAAKAKVVQTEQNLSAAYSRALQNYEAALASARNFAERILPDTKAHVELVRLMHAEGRASANEVLEAQSTLTRTEMATIEHIAALYKAVAELDYLARTNAKQEMRGRE